MVHIASTRHALKQQRREERERQQEAPQLAQLAQGRRRRATKYIIATVISIVLVGIITFIFLSASSKAGPYDAFAQCLTEKHVVMYGAYWCPHCANQKKMFGSSFRYVIYVECDSKGKGAQPELCLRKGIDGYPTWEINGEMISGEVPLVDLARKSGCTLQHEAPAQTI